MKLQVMICTHKAAGLERVAKMSLPVVDEVGYIVSCQSVQLPIPESLCREDVEVHFAPTRGISANRNAAMALVTAPYALVADDDLEYYPDAFAKIIEAFEAAPDLAVAMLRSKSPSNKLYPDAPCSLYKPNKGYYPTSFEIAMRIDAIRQCGISFNELIGIGTDRFTCGEEDLLLLNVYRRGLKAMILPILVCNHPNLTTGVRAQSDPGVLRAQGLIIALAYGISKYPRLLLKAKRIGGTTIRNLYYLLQGWWEASRHPSRYV